MTRARLNKQRRTGSGHRCTCVRACMRAARARAQCMCMRAARTRTDHPDRNMVTGIYIGCLAFCWSLSGQGTGGAAEERRRKSHAPPHARARTHALCARARTHTWEAKKSSTTDSCARTHPDGLSGPEHGDEGAAEDAEVGRVRVAEEVDPHQRVCGQTNGSRVIEAVGCRSPPAFETVRRGGKRVRSGAKRAPFGHT